MMGLAQIEAESRKAARRSAAAKQEPLVLYAVDDVFGAPFIGDRVPRGWSVLRYTDLTDPVLRGTGPWPLEYRRGFYGDNERLGILLFVDSSGWGGPGESALDMPAIKQAVADILAAAPAGYTIGWAIYEVGQFQAHLRVFKKRYAEPTCDCGHPFSSHEGEDGLCDAGCDLRGCDTP